MDKQTKACKKCKSEIVKNAIKCPNCGTNQGMPIWLIVVVGIILICVIGSFIGEDSNTVSNSDNYSNNNSAIIPENNETHKNEIKELTEAEKLVLKIVGLMDDNLAFDTGSYIKGDIPAGEYAFVKFSGSGSYYCEKDASGNIIDNENFDSFGYVKVHSVGNLTTDGVLINVNAFEQLEISGAKEIYEIINEQENYNQSGYYKVGVDIQPGTYVLESIGSGYYAIMTGPVGSSDIIDNDNFNGKSEVNIKNGQYLEISRVQITK